MALSYFINRKKTTCVITFQGSLTSNDVEVMDTCLREATEAQSAYYILNLGGLVEVEESVARGFTLFQQGLRNGSKLYLCDIQAEPARVLKAGGLMRESEVMPDLLTTLQAILNEESG